MAGLTSEGGFGGAVDGFAAVGAAAGTDALVAAAVDAEDVMLDTDGGRGIEAGAADEVSCD